MSNPNVQVDMGSFIVDIQLFPTKDAVAQQMVPEIVKAPTGGSEAHSTSKNESLVHADVD